MESWRYSDQGLWLDIFGATCAGEGQSPVNINASKVLDGGSSDLMTFSAGHKLGPLVWSHLNATVRAVPSLAQGTWSLLLEAPYDSTTKTVYFGTEFRLQHLTLHSPSENTINGQHYDMEVQLLHTPTGGQGMTQVLVTSVMLRATVGGTSGDAVNGFMESLRSGYTGSSSVASPSGGIFIGNPYQFLYPRDRSYYSFNGSTTSPPCSPAIWVVFATPAEISQGQLQFFRSSMSGVSPNRLRYAPQEPAPSGVSPAWDRSLGTNARAIQPLGSRWVKRVRMSNAPSASSLPAAGGGGGWFGWGLAGLAVLALAGGTVFVALRDARESRDSREERPGGGGLSSRQLLVGVEGPGDFDSFEREAYSH